MNILVTRIFLGVTLIGLTGCTTLPVYSKNKDQYYWGGYEHILYDMYHNPSQAEPSSQIARLTTIIEYSESLGKRVPPGVYAHLGMMYFDVNDYDEALIAFDHEKRLFPESSIMIDGIVARITESDL